MSFVVNGQRVNMMHTTVEVGRDNVVYLSYVENGTAVDLMSAPVAPWGDYHSMMEVVHGLRNSL